MGLPVYIDLASVIDVKEKGDLLSSRDIKELQVTKIMRDAFNVPINNKTEGEHEDDKAYVQKTSQSETN